MGRHLITIISVAASILLFSCCKTGYEKGSLQPEWEVQIPTGTSEEIFYSGLPNLPKYGDLIVAHTTVRDEGFWAEDNRLCAINTKTGDIVWYFPADLDVKHYCHFDAKGYANNGKLVFQYAKNFHDETVIWDVTTLCMDIRDGSVLWEIEGRRPNKNRPTVGRNNECYFSPDSCNVYKADLNTNQVQPFFNTGDKDICINDLALCDNSLVVSCYSLSEEEYMLESFVMVLDCSTGEEKFRRHLGRETVPSHSLLEGNILYSNLETSMMAIDISKDETLWERDDYWAYVLMDMYIYKDVILKCAGNATVGYNKKTGEIIYSYRDYGSWNTSVDGKYAYFINCCDDDIDIIDIESGEKLDKIVCPYGNLGFGGSYPAIYDNKMYVMGERRLFRYPTYPWN